MANMYRPHEVAARQSTQVRQSRGIGRKAAVPNRRRERKAQAGAGQGDSRQCNTQRDRRKSGDARRQTGARLLRRGRNRINDPKSVAGGA